ncbi:MAG TPA: hypothetical protein DCO79_14840 [Spirochaeta sp.]|nr:hypothetical protein [Spirochaeta sp.]
MEEKRIKPARPLSDEEKQLLDSADSFGDELTELLASLVRIDSRNPAEDEFCERSEVFKFADGWMKDAGMDSKLYKAPFDDEGRYYYNLVSELKGNKAGKILQFCGHLDIVPFNEKKWDEDTPPLGGTIKNGRLYGRGAADMKAGIACQMIAMKALKNSGVDFNGKLQMWFTPDEETHGKFGSAFLPKQFPGTVHADATIISEPTLLAPMHSPTIGIDEKGPCWVKLTFFGVAGHGSMPKKNSNALNKAVRFMAEAERKLRIPKRKVPMSLFSFFRSLMTRFSISQLRKMEFSTGKKDPLDRDKISLSSLFKTTYSFNKIKAGTKTNVIPDTCELEIDFRKMPGLSTQELFNAVAKYCGRLGYRIKLPEGWRNIQTHRALKDTPVDVELSIIAESEGSFHGMDSEFGRCLKGAFEALYESSVVEMFSPGFTDGGNMRDAGMKDVFILGPGGGHIHEANEYAEIEPMLNVMKLYLLTAFRYLNSN